MDQREERGLESEQPGEEHLHSHGAEHGGDRRRLLIALGLTSGMLVAEAIGGWLSGSLALLSDAGHMLTDAGALLLSLLAIWFATRPADLKRTYGFFRLEVLSALINGVTLVGIAILVAYEAIARIAHPQPIQAPLMMGVAALGLVVNVIALFTLSHSHNMNVRGAFLHVLGDTLSSIGVLVAGAIVWSTGWTLADPIVSLGISVIIAISAIGLVKRAVHVLIEGVPEHIDLREVFSYLRSLPDVTSVHDLHLWTIGQGMHALSAHLVLCDGEHDRDALIRASRIGLRERFEIDHATLQLESEALARELQTDRRCVEEPAS